MSLANSFMKALINSPFHFLLGPNFAVITVKGRKTGKLISTPVNVTWDGQVYNITSMRDRLWWRNLRGGATADLRLGGKLQRVSARVLEAAPDVQRGLQDYFTRNPRLARYFNVRFAADGQLDPADLEKAAQARVIIRLAPLP